MDIRHRIVSEAFELFMKYGIRGVTMDQVACHLGISKRTLYETFRDKDELVREGVDHFANLKTDEAVRIMNESDNVIETIYMLGIKGEEIKAKINPLFFEDIRKFYPEIHSHLNSKGKATEYSMTYTLIKKGVNDGMFKKGLNVELVNIFFHEIMNIAMQEEIFPKEKYSRNDILKNILMPYLMGISTEIGREQIEKYFENEIKL